MVLPIFVSAILFYLSFPNFYSLTGFSFLAWIFAVPLFFAFEKKSFYGRLRVGLVWGLLANLSTLNWMIPYSLPGYVLLCAALASQMIVFCALYPSSTTRKFWRIFYVPSAWVVSEFLRKILMFGQSWDLGHSQSFDILLLQTARLLGSPGISFVLISVNYGLYLVFFGLKETRSRIQVAFFVLLIAGAAYGFGYFILNSDKPLVKTALKICVIQPNIDYHGDLSVTKVDEITRDLISWTKCALKNSQPDLVVWPETAIPFDFLRDAVLRVQVTNLVKESGIPFIIGAAISQGQALHNSAVFLESPGRGKDDL